MIHLIRAEIERLILTGQPATDVTDAGVQIGYAPGLPYHLAPAPCPLDELALELDATTRGVQVLSDMPTASEDWMAGLSVPLCARYRVLCRYHEAGWDDAYSRLRDFVQYDACRIVACVTQPPGSAWGTLQVEGTPRWVAPATVRKAKVPGVWILDLLFEVLFRQSTV